MSVPLDEDTRAGLAQLAEQQGRAVAAVAADLLSEAVSAARPPSPALWRRVVGA